MQNLFLVKVTMNYTIERLNIILGNLYLLKGYASQCEIHSINLHMYNILVVNLLLPGVSP